MYNLMQGKQSTPIESLLRLALSASSFLIGWVLPAACAYENTPSTGPEDIRSKQHVLKRHGDECLRTSLTNYLQINFAMVRSTLPMGN